MDLLYKQRRQNQTDPGLSDDHMHTAVMHGLFPNL